MTARANLLIALAIASSGYWLGYIHSANHYQAKEAAAAIASARALTSATAAAAKKEQALNLQFLAQSVKLQTAQADHENQINHLRAAVRAGTYRLSIPTAPNHHPAAGTNPTTPGQSGTEARAELMPETADALVSIAGDGDSAILQLNALIDAWQTLKTACDSTGPTNPP